MLKVAQINVTTTNGVVAQNGVVHSQQSIDKATEIVQSVKQLKSVVKDLVIKGS